MNKALKTRQELLNQLEAQETAVETGPNSVLGRRAAYEILVKQQRERYGIVLNNKMTDIVGAVYGDNNHFIFRYVCDGNVYEADGMLQHTLSTKDVVIRVAQSVLIDEPYELAMAGRIACRMRKNIKVGGKVVVDVFYIRR
jgi:hypothetical protein